MKKINSPIRILNAASGMWTSAKRAIAYIEQGRARYIDEQTIEMITEHPAHQCAVRSVASSRPRRRGRPALNILHAAPGPESMRTFARYPETGAFEAQI